MRLILQRKNVLPLLIILFLWNVGIFLTPLLMNSTDSISKTIAGWLSQLYGSVCHQQPQRSWYFNNLPLPTCIRCTMFYLSGLFIVIFYFIRKNIPLFPLKYYLYLVLPTLIDFTLEWCGLYHHLPIIRIFTAPLLAYAIFHGLLRSINT